MREAPRGVSAAAATGRAEGPGEGMRLLPAPPLLLPAVAEGLGCGWAGWADGLAGWVGCSGCGCRGWVVCGFVRGQSGLKLSCRASEEQGRAWGSPPAVRASDSTAGRRVSVSPSWASSSTRTRGALHVGGGALPELLPALDREGAIVAAAGLEPEAGVKEGVEPSWVGPGPGPLRCSPPSSVPGTPRFSKAGRGTSARSLFQRRRAAEGVTPAAAAADRGGGRG
ncbi:hypothetical protein V8C86DRAFT_2638145 [Haematococcus lacustris]